MIDERAIELTRLMQSAAYEPTQWGAALDAVDRFVGGKGVGLLSVAVRQRFTPVSTDMAEMMEDYFSGGWHLRDRREACLPLLKQKGIVVDQDFQSIADIENCDYYHDFLARHDCKWFAGIGADIDGDEWCLALQRSRDAEPFGASDMARLELVRNALIDTARLSGQVGRAWIFGLQHALDLMEQPAIVLDNRARVANVNAAAAAILAAHIGRDGMLRFDAADTAATFDAMLRSALFPFEASHRGAVWDVHIDDRRFACRATSLLGHEDLIASSAAAIVVMEPISRSPARLMKTRYGLTDTEIRVSLAIAGGRSVSEVAAANGVKEGTIRAQLKSIYAKTAINKQSRLVAFVRDLADDPGD